MSGDQSKKLLTHNSSLHSTLDTQNSRKAVLISIRSKILLIVFSFLLITIILVCVYSVLQTQHYESLLLSEMSHTMTFDTAHITEIFKDIESRSQQFIAIFVGIWFVLLIWIYFEVSRYVIKPIEKSTREHIENERMSAELDLAKKIQSSMLPHTFPPFPNRQEFEIYASMTPAREVGGDFYDFFFVNKNTLAIAIADVSGKGTAAALFMARTRTLLKDIALTAENPNEVFARVNNRLCEYNDAGMFVTAFLGYLDILTGKLIFVNAGHTPPLIKKEKYFEELDHKSDFVLANLENITYQQYEIYLKQNDILLLYTDGITEAMNKNQTPFGKERLINTANKNKDLPLENFCQELKKEIDTFAQEAEQSDDVTMLVLRMIETGALFTSPL